MSGAGSAFAFLLVGGAAFGLGYWMGRNKGCVLFTTPMPSGPGPEDGIAHSQNPSVVKAVTPN